MGFNIRYITKDLILSCLKEGGDVNKLLTADALIMDSWSSRFFDSYDKSNEYEEIKDELKNQVEFSSNLDDTLNNK